MAIITEADALLIVSLATMKDELRIEQTETSHDSLLASQIQAAASYVKEHTGREVGDLAELRPAIVAAVRDQYDGYRELSPIAAAYAWLQPYRSYKAG